VAAAHPDPVPVPDVIQEANHDTGPFAYSPLFPAAVAVASRPPSSAAPATAPPLVSRCRTSIVRVREGTVYRSGATSVALTIHDAVVRSRVGKSRHVIGRGKTVVTDVPRGGREGRGAGTLLKNPPASRVNAATRSRPAQHPDGRFPAQPLTSRVMPTESSFVWSDGSVGDFARSTLRRPRRPAEIEAELAAAQ
jgi:hypothetical protein